jgi:hypothetical protein
VPDPSSIPPCSIQPRYSPIQNSIADELNCHHISSADYLLLVQLPGAVLNLRLQKARTILCSADGSITFFV